MSDSDEYVRRLREARLGAVADVLRSAGYGDFAARQIAYDIFDAQLQAEAEVLSADARERSA